MALFNRIGSGINKVSTNMSIAGSWLLFALMILVVTDVILRYLFNMPISGVPEILRNAMVVMFFLQLPYGTSEKRHVKTTLLNDRVSPKVCDFIEAFSFLMGSIIFLIIVTGSYSPMIKDFIVGEYEGEGSIRIPVFPIRLILTIGATFTFYHFTRLMIVDFKNVIFGSKMKEIKQHQ